MITRKEGNLMQWNGLRLNASAENFIQIKTKKDIVEAARAAQEENLPLHPLGDGTNTVWGKDKVEKFVVKIDIRGWEVLRENNLDVLVKIGAGENWDKCVAKSVAFGLSGIEALSGIPGTAGAAPIQNIGAYGTEIKDTLESVEVYDAAEKIWKEFKNTTCRFSYRDSIFKRNPGRYIITSITLKLSKTSPSIPDYRDVKSHFNEKNIIHPSLQEIRETILNIRSKKLPDPEIIPNCGSFFKNPIIKKRYAKLLKEKFPDMPQFPFEDRVKVPAGWLIEKLGLKGKRFGTVEVYKHNALVLAAPDKNASRHDLLEAKEYISDKALETFGIELEMEPEIVL